jgi:hypothetical protein
MVDEKLRKGVRVCDVGCGNGRALFKLSKVYLHRSLPDTILILYRNIPIPLLLDMIFLTTQYKKRHKRQRKKGALTSRLPKLEPRSTSYQAQSCLISTYDLITKILYPYPATLAYPIFLAFQFRYIAFHYPPLSLIKFTLDWTGRYHICFRRRSRFS